MTTKKTSAHGPARVVGVLVVALLLLAKSVTAGTRPADYWTAVDPHGSPTVTSNGSSVTVLFAGNPFSDPAAVSLLAQSTNLLLPLTGDLRQAGVTALTFTISGSSAPLPFQSCVMLEGAGGNLWLYRSLSLGTTMLAMTNGAQNGWILGIGSATNLDAAWDADCQSVASLGLRLHRNLDFATSNQTRTVSGFHLNAFTLADALEAAFGIGIRTVEQVDPFEGSSDDDNDGMSLLEEILMEHQPGYFEDNFRADLGSLEDAIIVRFAAREGRVYDIEHADRVEGAYNWLDSVSVTNTGIAEYPDVGAGAGPRFYRVIEQ